MQSYPQNKNLLRFVFSGALLIVAPSQLLAVAAEIEDVSKNQVVYEYLQKVENETSKKTFESVRYDLMVKLVENLGEIDFWNLDSTEFIKHLQYVQSIEANFYKSRPLSGDEVKADLAPYRIRYELTPQADWMTRLGSTFRPITNETVTADEAAAAIFAWMSKNLKILNPALAYPIPNRGDLDPLSTLTGGYGTEIDIAIFGVGALRASGIAARLVWTPALRGETGGKAWLEYLGENKIWQPWVPSFGTAVDHRGELGRRLGQKIVLVLARPDNPLEITEAYAETMVLELNTPDEGVELSILVQGKDALLPYCGNDLTLRGSKRFLRIGRGAVVIAASFAKRSFALLPIDPKLSTKTIEIIAEGGKLTYSEEKGSESGTINEIQK